MCDVTSNVHVYDIEDAYADVGQSVIDQMMDEVHDRPDDELYEDALRDGSHPVAGIMRVWIGWFENAIASIEDGDCGHGYGQDTKLCEQCAGVMGLFEYVENSGWRIKK